MATTLDLHPAADEHLPYYEKYVMLTREGNPLDALETEIVKTAALLGRVSERDAGYAYAPGKWTLREVAGHMCDAERVFASRALWFARGEQAPLPGFDENAWVPAGRFESRTLADLVIDLRVVRAATVAMYRGFPPEVFTHRGVANGAGMSVRAALCVTLGHERHTTAILRERYGLKD